MNAILIVDGKIFNGRPSEQMLTVPVVKLLPGMISPYSMITVNLN